MAKYVGKRIVPLPCGEWNQNKEYEMLSVVLHKETGDSYMARRQVPAGTAITDTAFWAKSSEWSQQVKNMSDQLTQTLRDVKADNDDTEAAIKQDNDATAKAIKDDNDETETAIKEDNKATADRIDQTVADALSEMSAAKQSFNTTSASLSTRMNSIAGQATGDTEILDARVDENDVTHENLGEHIRYVDRKGTAALTGIRDILADAEAAETEEYEFEFTEKAVIDKNGKVTVSDNLSGGYRVSDAVEVTPGYIYRITAGAYYNKYVYVFYDKDDNVIEGQYETTTVAVVKVEDKLIIAPADAVTLRIAWVGNLSYVGKIGKVTRLIFPAGRLTGELLVDYGIVKDKVQAAYDYTVNETKFDGYVFEEEEIEFEVTGDRIIQSSDGKIAPLVREDLRYKVSDLIPVTPMDLLSITACCNYANGIYAFYDEDEKAIEIIKAEGGSATTKVEDEKVVVPLGAAYLRIAYTDYTFIGTVKKLTRAGYKGTFTGNLEGDVTGNVTGNLTGDVTGNVNGSVLKWAGKKWVVVGDSHTEHNGRATMNYHDYVAENTGISVVNMGYSGSGYKRREENNKAFYQKILEVPTDADVVTIYGSGNDLSQELGEVTDTGTDTLCGCMNTTLDNFNSVCPTVPIGVVTPCPWSGYNPKNDNNKMALYSAALMEICRQRGIPCLDLYHCSGLRPWDLEYRKLMYTRDDGGGCHPDENGHKQLAPKFEAFLETLIL